MINIEQNDLLGEKEMARVTSIYRLTYILGVYRSLALHKQDFS